MLSACMVINIITTTRLMRVRVLGFQEQPVKLLLYKTV
jgi:hypothetical protein